MNSFFSMVSRMKYINRWGLMRNTRTENLSEHSLEVAVVAHALGVLRNRRFGGSVNVERLALIAMYHDAPEIITGDLPTPIKYFNPEIKSAYKKVESTAAATLLSLLPGDLREEYSPLLIKTEKDGELWTLVRAADKIAALIKCIEENQSGNKEFEKARTSLLQTIQEMQLKEADVFIREFIPSYYLSLDEQ